MEFDTHYTIDGRAIRVPRPSNPFKSLKPLRFSNLRFATQSEINAYLSAYDAQFWHLENLT
jgi:hypothetical protein